MTSATKRISAVVCTRDRGEALARTLAAFERQTLAPRLFELIIVDNGSRDDTASVCAPFIDKNGNFRYVREDRVGLSIARNVGLAGSEAELVAYTDDDAEPEPSWLERLVSAFDSLPSSVGIVGGDVIPVWQSQRPEWLSDGLLRPLSAGLKWSVEPRFLGGDEWLIEVNSAYRKAALKRVEGFPEHLGRVGDMLLSGEGAVNILIGRAGYQLYYDPRILVRHHIPSTRATKAWFRRRSFWQGVSLCRVHRYLDEETRRLGLETDDRRSRGRWEELGIPLTPSGWASLFDDRSAENFDDHLCVLEQLGYLLESQAVVVGR